LLTLLSPDPQEALPLRLCHSTPERRGSLLLRRDPNAQKVGAEEGLRALEWRRCKVRELQPSCEILARYRKAVPEEPEKADGKEHRAVYNTLRVTVRAAKVKEDPIKAMFSALGGEEVCRSDATSTR